MSSGGSGEDDGRRTVFRPSPLQALREQQQGHADTAFSPVAPAGEAPQPSAPQVLPDDDIPAPAAAPDVRNPLMAAAGPGLALAASIRSGRVRMPLSQLHPKVAEMIGAFDGKIAPMCSEEHRRRALYAVAATFDDVAQNLPGQSADGAEWARRSMVVRFFNENIGGDRLWQIVEDMLKRPAEYGLLIELYHACLAAGFEGRFRVLPDGRRRLDEVMTQLYATLEHPRALSQIELSPHWRGEASPIRKVGFWTPLLAAGGAALGLLLVIYVVLRLVLGQTGLPAAQALSAINPDERLRLSRAAAAAQAPAGAQATRLKQFLAPEIRQGLVVVEEDPSTVRVRTTVGDLFRSGSDQLEPGRRALFERIGSAVDTEPGPVRVEGHADSDRVSGLTFPDNMALSAARARTVSAILRGRLAEPARVVAEGFGDSTPLASNETARGKALNRRVEIVVPRAAGP